MTTYEFLVRSISNFTYLDWLQLYLSGMATNFPYM